MHPLTPPDSHHALAAIGWLELGNAVEAQAELLQVSARYADHPDVLETWYAVHAHRADWNAALPVADQLIARAPERTSGWLHRAYALRRVPHGGLAAARAALLPAVEKFPDEPTVTFNLACYDCQLGQLEKAWSWLERALASGERKAILAMALADPDLEPLRERIVQLSP